MNVLLIIRNPPVNVALHRIVLGLVDRLITEKKVNLTGLFLTDDACILSSASLKEIDELHSIQLGYMEVSRKINAPILVCGRALIEHGIDRTNVAECFEISGNVELSMNIFNADKVIEF